MRIPYTTYTTQRKSFVGSPDPRTAWQPTQDEVYINTFPCTHPEIEGNRYYLEMRPGLMTKSGVTPNAVTAGRGRGLYYWGSFSTLYFVVGSTLYLGTTPTATALQTLSTTTNAVKFYEFADAVNQKFLILLDGTDGYVIKGDNTVTKITSPNFPTQHCVQAAVLDGYLFVAKLGTADIYNCNLNDPFTWTAGDFISAEAFPDNLWAVVRQNNYVVAIGELTTEFFYDAGTSPGTPLARNTSAYHQIGTFSQESVVQAEEQIIFVGQTQTGGRSVWMYEGFNPVEIGTEAVKQGLAAAGANAAFAKAFYVRTKGHKFYVLQIPTTDVSHLSTFLLPTTAWVYDFDTKLWHQWADYSTTNPFSCNSAADHASGQPYLLDASNGQVYILDSKSSSDAGGGMIKCIAVTNKLDFGSMNNKFMHRFTLICNSPQASGGSANLSLSWSDDDYVTFSTGRLLPPTTMPTVTQLGRFRRRAFRLDFTSTEPIRIEGFEVDLNIGSR